MFNEHHDQAAGLRRLFQAAPPRVVGVVPCSASLMPWLARQIQLRVQRGQRLLALDEWSAYGNLADSLHVSPRFDLLQAAEQSVAFQDCLSEVFPGLHVAAVSRMAAALGNDRTLNQRVLALLKEMQAHSAEWLVVARPADALGVSPLLAAVPQLVLVIDARPESVTAAYVTLKQLTEREDVPIVHVAINELQGHEALALAANLKRVAHEQLGVNVSLSGSLVQSLERAAANDRGGFMERLLRAASRPARRGAGWRPKYACI